MEIDLTQVALLLSAKVQAFFEHSFLWSALKFFLFVYTLVLFVDVMILMIMKGFSSDLKAALYGAQRPLISQTKMIKRWEGILERLESDNPSQYKVAILEADALANEILSGIGYEGSTMAEQLEAVQGGQLETKTLLMEAHEARNQIIRDPAFVLSREEAKKYLEDFKQFFDEVELF